MTNGVQAPASGLAGAHWIRAALQVNPFAYQGMGAPSSKFADEASYNTALLDRCIAEDIQMIAITDHWAVDTAAGLVADATARDIVALPGFEANSAEGVHLLVIFEKDTPFADINAAIGDCGVTPGVMNGSTGKPYKEILELMSGRHALVIPAHVNVANSGMLTGRTGIPLVQMVKHANLHAIGVSPGVAATADQAAILSGTRPYDRDHPLVGIHADDISHPDTLGTQGAATWFKVSNACLESLKHAVRTPGTRVAIVDPTTTPRAVIREVSWQGGFLDNVTVSLSHDLTAFIGGRGTGKSTVLESLRYALNIEPLGLDAQKDHQAIVKDVLKSGTTIRVEVDAITPTPGRFVIQRTVPDPPIVFDASGTATSFKPEDVIGLVEIFGQHELAELAHDKPSIALMLERFAGPSQASQDRPGIVAKLVENRRKLDKAEADRAALEEELSDMPRLQEQVDLFAKTDLATRMEEQRRLVQDESVFQEGESRLIEVQSVVDHAKQSDVVATLTSSIDAVAGSSEEALLAAVQAATSKLAFVVQVAIDSIEAAHKIATDEIGSAHAAWVTATATQKAGHAEIIRELVAEGADPDRYMATTAALEKLTTKALKRAGFDSAIKSLAKDRKGLLNELAANDAEVSKHLVGAIRNANAATSKAVNVRPIPSPDRQHIKDVIDSKISGQRTQIMAAIEKDDFSPRAFATAARAGAADLESQFGIRGSQQAAILNGKEPLFREIEELSVGQAVDVLLDTSVGSGTQSFRQLEQLSKGQRATALLLLLLSASNSPLVIDQPEDDLDNKFVYNEIVQKLRDLKGSRQIIVSTHNANVPVLGDAELVIALEGDGQKGWPIVDGVGSLDDKTIRELAEDLLEGGRAAFDARQHLYGF